MQIVVLLASTGLIDCPKRNAVDISAWLRELGLERYEQAFRDNAIDAGVLPKLTAEDLRDIGIAAVGHRRRLLEAIAALAGQPQAAPTTADAGVPQATKPPEAERRQLTVLFGDLAGSTALSAKLDPEDMGALIRAYHACCADVVRRWGGHVAKYLGDGVLAYFGWPQAHEDDAERAVRAGLDLVTAVARLTTGAGMPLAARVGIATGLVMVGELIGEGVAREQTVVGETPNLAARLQALASPGSVVISQATRRLVGGLFELADLGPQRLKGFAEPLSAWRVEGEGRAEGRFEALHGERLTPLVGREHELGILLERWAWAKDGEGQVVLLSGEPGIGKSRVVRALRERLGGEPYTPLSHYCSPYHANSALHPVIGLLERAARFERDEPPQERLSRLEAVLGRASDRLDEAVPLLAALLGVPTGERYPARTLTPEVQKRRTLQALVDQLAGLATRQPVLALYEDVHWIDPSTLELLGLVIERVQRLPVLVLLTFRPEFQPPWTGQAHVTAVTMGRLGRRQGADLVARVTGDKPLPAAIIDQIVARTDGIPLFVEELTKTVLESGLLADAGDHYELSGPLPPLAIPTTLHDSLMARLDRLAPVKEIAQIGAAIGREFSHELLTAVAPMSASQLADALEQLVRSELVFRGGTPPEATYSFKHALVQDAAYQSLLKSRRQQLHGRIAHVLEERFPETAATQPELLAHHFAEARQIERAVDYWLKAGERAAARSANLEAIRHLTRGLEALETLPESPERDRQELMFQIAIGTPLIAVQGYSAPQTGAAFSRARVLCERLGEAEPLVAALSGEFVYHFVLGNYPLMRRLTDEARHVAERLPDPVIRLAGHRLAGITAMHFGAFAEARAEFEAILRLYEASRHRSQPVHYVHDPKVSALTYLALVFWLLGFPAQAQQSSVAAFGCAAELNQANLTAHVHNFAGAGLGELLGDAPRVRVHSDAMVELADRHDLRAWRLNGLILRGWTMVQEGAAEAGIELMCQNAADRAALRVRWYQARYLCMLAGAYAQVGRAEPGLRAIAEAKALAARNDEHMWEAELDRVEGDLLKVQGGSGPEIEACFARAVAVARRQGAKSLELRAASSMAGLWRDHGRRAEAHDLLAPIYGWFTEGLDTADLKDAKVLLDELA
jgi:class 3 adenylate cyclase/predicted ATPase